MPPPTWVNTILRCNVHRKDHTFCVHVDQEVPEPLRCAPQGGGGGGGGGTLTGCHCSSGMSGADLARLVKDAVRHGWGRWVKLGAVVIEC
jgi:hypothetical protein